MTEIAGKKDHTLRKRRTWGDSLLGSFRLRANLQAQAIARDADLVILNLLQSLAPSKEKDSGKETKADDKEDGSQDSDSEGMTMT